MNLPERYRGYVLAFIVVAIPALLVWLIVLAPLLERLEAQRTLITRDERLLTAYVRTLAAADRSAGTEGSSPSERILASPLLWHESSMTLVGAGFQAALRRMARQADVQVQSIALATDDKPAGIAQVSATMNMKATQKALAQFLSAIGNNTPLIGIESLRIRKENAGAHRTGATEAPVMLAVTCTLYGPAGVTQQ